MEQNNNNLRISKQHGRIMVAIAVFFDLLPIIALGVMLYILFQAVVTGDVGSALEHYSAAERAAERSFEADDSTLSGVLEEIFIHDNVNAYHKLAATYYGAKVIIGASGASVIAFFIGPLIYEIVSFSSTIVAYLLFTLWFLFKKVNIWSFTKPKKVFLNLITMIVEEIPILDLLPGTTIMVWRHVKMSQVEDTIKNNKIIASGLSKINKTAYV
jgi:hypothetical protein